MMDIIQIIGCIASIATIVGAIWAIWKNWQDIEKWLEKLCKFFDKCISTIDFPRRSLARRMNSSEFLEWQDGMLLNIYGEGSFTEILGKKYPVVSVDFYNEENGYDEVDSLCKDEYGNYLLKKEGEEVNLPDIYDTEIMTNSVAKEIPAREAELSLKKGLMGSGWGWKGYKWFTARSMRDGNHIGFVLDHVDFDNNKIKKIHLSVGSYKLNLLTSHILTYEMFKAYEKLRKQGKDVNNVKKEELWPMIPFRYYIHNVNDNDINKVLFTGLGRYALLSVQCMVMVCTTETGQPRYKTFLGKRSESTREVSTKLGCYQFPPSGGFDLYDEDDLHDMEIIESNCSLRLALMREYLEEVFGEKRYAKVDKSNSLESTASIELVNDDYRTKEIRKMLKTPLEDNRFKSGTKKAYFTTVGANVDLIDLRLSVNFMLVINDYSYYHSHKDKFTYNEELKAKTKDKTKDKSKNKSESKCKMLRSLEYVDKTLRGERKIVEDSVALYAQGTRAFEKYISNVKNWS